MIWQQLTCKIKDLSMTKININFTCAKFKQGVKIGQGFEDD